MFLTFNGPSSLFLKDEGWLSGAVSAYLENILVVRRGQFTKSAAEKQLGVAVVSDEGVDRLFLHG